MEKQLIERERKNSIINSKQLEVFIHGGEVANNLRKKCNEIVAKDPILNEGLKRYSMSIEEQRELSTRKCFRLAELLHGQPEDYQLALKSALAGDDRSTGIRFFVQYTLWCGTIENQGNDEQRKLWLDDARARQYKLIGCFCMTELGHSSHLRGAETTATFDVEKDCFVLNSPTITSSKWWIGQAGQIATHGIVFAQLITQNKNCGLQLFIVPLRDPKTGCALPSVTIGDIGEKYGRNGNDNGFIRFENVCVPRANMLARWSSVSRDGSFQAPPSPALVYGSTVAERVASIVNASDFVSRALTIAVRFGALRRQGTGNPQLLDYSTHQRLLMPILARCYALIAVGRRCLAKYSGMVAALRNNDTAGFLAPLEDMHATACAGKAFETWFAADALEACRRSMGGTAYSQYSGIPALIADFGVLTTGGGDNIVMAQQAARYLVKQFQRSSISLEGTSVYYLAQNIADVVLEPNSFLILPTLLAVIGSLTRARLANAVELLNGEQHRGASFAMAWNVVVNDLVDVVECHSAHYRLESFIEFISSGNHLSNGTKEILCQMARLDALSFIRHRVSWFIEAGLFSTVALPLLRSACSHLCATLRRDAVALVDAFDHSDESLKAPIAPHDGDMYTKYSTACMQSSVAGNPAPYWQSVVVPQLNDSPLFKQPSLFSKL